MTGSRKLYVKSFGCQMNVYDSQRMADTLAPEGYVETAAADDADRPILGMVTQPRCLFAGHRDATVFSFMSGTSTAASRSASTLIS